MNTLRILTALSLTSTLACGASASHQEVDEGALAGDGKDTPATHVAPPADDAKATPPAPSCSSPEGTSALDRAKRVAAAIDDRYCDNLEDGTFITKHSALRLLREAKASCDVKQAIATDPNLERVVNGTFERKMLDGSLSADGQQLRAALVGVRVFNPGMGAYGSTQRITFHGDFASVGTLAIESSPPGWLELGVPYDVSGVRVTIGTTRPQRLEFQVDRAGAPTLVDVETGVIYGDPDSECDA